VNAQRAVISINSAAGFAGNAPHWGSIIAQRLSFVDIAVQGPWQPLRHTAFNSGTAYNVVARCNVPDAALISER
jgi:hypothetical protein